MDRHGMLRVVENNTGEMCVKTDTCGNYNVHDVETYPLYLIIYVLS